MAFLNGLGVDKGWRSISFKTNCSKRQPYLNASVSEASVEEFGLNFVGSVAMVPSQLCFLAAYAFGRRSFVVPVANSHCSQQEEHPIPAWMVKVVNDGVGDLDVSCVDPPATPDNIHGPLAVNTEIGKFEKQPRKVILKLHSFMAKKDAFAYGDGGVAERPPLIRSPIAFECELKHIIDETKALAKAAKNKESPAMVVFQRGCKHLRT